ncbi:hypothetical protein [Paraburkholderia fungorum]|uniref:hypothetical protein n=1 Tax=Paraburkholderia fungorum TaxID=134537 RepID=UPI0038B99F76
MKRFGLALLMAVFAPAAFATGGYTEVWNPPEARATMPRKTRAAHNTAMTRHVIPHAVKVHTHARHVPTSAAKLMAKQSNPPRAVPANEPDTSDIPRQITPEGNVLRVNSRGMVAEVTR